MKEKIDEAIQKMAEMVKASPQPDAAMKFAQAALNLANAKATLALSEDPGAQATSAPKKRGRPPADRQGISD